MNKSVKFFLKIIQKLKLEKAVYFMARNINPSFFLQHFWDSKKSLLDFYKLYLWYSELINAGKVKLNNKKILEIGAGSSFGCAYFFFDHNIRSWLSIDKYNCLNFESELDRSNEFLRKNGFKKNYKKFFVCKKDKVINFTSGLSFLQADIINNNLPEKYFDIVFSNATFEHIDKDFVNKSIKNIGKCLKKNGYCISIIDLRDHFNFDNPFNFYKYSEKEWTNLTSNTIIYTNRLRSIDFIKSFEKNGFELIFSEFEYKKLNKNINLSANFSKYNKSELQKSLVKLVFKKVK